MLSIDAKKYLRISRFYIIFLVFTQFKNTASWVRLQRERRLDECMVISGRLINL